jgi:hypothetical protein
MCIRDSNNIGKYGAGLSGALSRKWPNVESDYRAWFNNKPGNLDMGLIQISTMDTHLAVVNMVAQYGVRSHTNPNPMDYKALEMCLIRLFGILAQLALKHRNSKRFKIWCPKIGSGLAGGDWSIIKPMVEHWFVDRDFELTFVEFE